MVNMTDKRPKVSVIMNGLNCSKYLKEAIDSVYAQTYKDWEIIFWDNASIDSSAAIAKGYDSKLKYYRGDETVPLYKARNYALEKAKGEYIAFLDSDDFWLPHKLEKQVAILENLPDIDFIYTNYFRIIMPKTTHLILGLKKKQPNGYVFERFLYNYPVNLQTVMLRKAVLNKLNALFDERLNLSGDFDLFMRILYNSKTAYIHDPSVIYRIHSEMLSIRFLRDFPEESEHVIEKLKRLDPLMEKKYSNAFNYAMAKIGYWRARSEMKDGKTGRARNYLSPYRFVDYRFFLLYFITYFPSLWQRLHNFKIEGVLQWLYIRR